MLLLPKSCVVFWKRHPWVSLADVTLLVGVHKYLLNFWFKRVEDLHQSKPDFKNQKWGPSDFCLKRAERNLLCKSLPLGCVPYPIHTYSSKCLLTVSVRGRSSSGRLYLGRLSSFLIQMWLHLLAALCPVCSEALLP